MKRFKAHTIYKNKDGDPVIGVTTALQVLAKPYLVPWANKQGLQGISTQQFVEAMGEIGTVAHALVGGNLTGEKVDLYEHSQAIVDKAQIPYKKFTDWLAKQEWKVIFSEQALVSEKYQFGGCVDLLWILNGQLTLTDLKTSNSIHPEMFTQLSAYYQLLMENGYDVPDRINIIRIGRDKRDEIEIVEARELDLHFEIFKRCLEIHRIKEALGDW